MFCGHHPVVIAAVDLRLSGLALVALCPAAIYPFCEPNGNLLYLQQNGLPILSEANRNTSNGARISRGAVLEAPSACKLKSFFALIIRSSSAI